jgi:recombination protein RecR
MGRLSPLENVGPKDIRVRELLARVRSGDVREVILATNPTAEGDATASYLEKLLREREVKVTRPARGIPAGSALEFVDSGILGEAMRGRHE